MVYINCAPAKRKHGPDSFPAQHKVGDDWLMAQYIKFNLKYFDMNLPLNVGIYFRGNRYGSRLGTAFGHAGCFRGITINPYMCKNLVLATLLHEMVHAEQYIVRKTDGDHGRWFKSRCRELTVLTKKKYGVIK